MVTLKRTCRIYTPRLTEIICRLNPILHTSFIFYFGVMHLLKKAEKLSHTVINYCFALKRHFNGDNDIPFGFSYVLQLYLVNVFFPCKIVQLQCFKYLFLFYYKVFISTSMLISFECFLKCLSLGWLFDMKHESTLN